MTPTSKWEKTLWRKLLARDDSVDAENHLHFAVEMDARVFITFGGEWNDSEKDYVGGRMRGLTVDSQNVSSSCMPIACIPSFQRPTDPIPSFPSSSSNPSSSQQPHLYYGHLGHDIAGLTPLESDVVPCNLGDDRVCVWNMPGLWNDNQDESDESYDSLGKSEEGDYEAEFMNDDYDDARDEKFEPDVEQVQVEIRRDEVVVLQMGCDGLIGQPNDEKLQLIVQSSGTNDVKEGKVFDTKKELSLRKHLVAMPLNFQFKVKKSTPELYILRCVDSSCTWRLRAIKLMDCNLFKIKKYYSIHTCNGEVLKQDHRQAKNWVVRHLVQAKFTDVSCTYRPKDIIQDMRKEYGVNLSYDKAWQSTEEALRLIRGDPTTSYGLLPAYGFLACIRPVLVVDGAHLKGKFRWVLLTASGADANNQIYPVAFVIVDSALDVVNNLVFVSDRHQTICKAIDKVFSTAFHCFCIQHIKTNLLAKFKVDAKALEELFLKAAKAYQESYFNSIWAQLGAYPGMREYLDDIGKERWTRCFQTELRYTQMTSNNAESVNALFRHACSLPVTALLDHIREPIFPISHVSTWKSSPDFVDIPAEAPDLVPRVGKRQSVRIPPRARWAKQKFLW
ncbi:uncharacterized protein LOC111022954 [Momordica charantia]|uniref:Uncharacterized protein LOC111022954 n=1 Tax=Momordica charantia TaxID=3673 RepID=A0A6J1DP00_MOMCH|nr:uncharacterized protein LOC111022954 [Momordica charantia]